MELQRSHFLLCVSLRHALWKDHEKEDYGLSTSIHFAGFSFTVRVNIKKMQVVIQHTTLKHLYKISLGDLPFYIFA